MVLVCARCADGTARSAAATWPGVGEITARAVAAVGRTTGRQFAVPLERARLDLSGQVYDDEVASEMLAPMVPCAGARRRSPAPARSLLPVDSEMRKRPVRRYANPAFPLIRSSLGDGANGRVRPSQASSSMPPYQSLVWQIGARETGS